jgi:putative flippase GtrA
MRSPLDFRSRLSRNTRWLREFSAYIFVGGLAVACDFGALIVLSNLHVWWQVAVTVAYALALLVHFTLNRLNFGAFGRPFQQQLARYGMLALVQYVQTLLVVGIARHYGLSTVEGKIIAVAIGVPLGFLWLKYLTFGASRRSRKVLEERASP